MENSNLEVLLINPPVFDLAEKIKIMNNKIYPPLGLAYIAAVLEQKGFNVKIIDAFAEQLNEKKLRKRIEKSNASLVGVSNQFTSYCENAEKVAKIAKEELDAFVVQGGIHATIATKEVLKDKNTDLVICGEGEKTFNEIAKKLCKGKSIKGIAGTAEKKGKKIVFNKPRQFIQNLDELPFPARHLLPMQIYFEKEDLRWNMRFPKATIVTSRGCPGRCVYCSVHTMWGRTWRAHSAKRVVDEIESLVEEYGVREIDFMDDNIALNPLRMKEICNEIIERKIDIKWKTPNGIGHWTLNKELINLMKKSGCHRLAFGIESANSEIRKFIHKEHSLKQAEQIIRDANNAGIWTEATFILGFPYETKSQMQETIEWALKSDLDFALFYLLGVYPGTEIEEILKKEGLEKKCIEKSIAYDTKKMSAGELESVWKNANEKMRARIIKRFLNPTNIIKKIHSTEDILYLLKLAKTYAELVLVTKDWTGFKGKKTKSHEKKIAF